MIAYINYFQYTMIKDFPKERYNTYAKSCNSNLYTKYPGATYSGLLLVVTMIVVISRTYVLFVTIWLYVPI